MQKIVDSIIYFRAYNKKNLIFAHSFLKYLFITLIYMKIFVIAATQMELNAVLKNTSFNNIKTVVTGIGMLASATYITQLIIEQKPDIIIQIGIAGCFDKKIPLGTVMLVQQEFYGDLGVTEKGTWYDIFDLKLQKPNTTPHHKKGIVNTHIKTFNKANLPVVKAVTVNQITTSKKQIAQLQQCYQPILESMEGMALHFVCSKFNTPYLQLRAVSNYIGERDKSKWNFSLAFNNLNIALKEIIKV
jgi:futalosine hydrolase